MQAGAGARRADVGSGGAGIVLMGVRKKGEVGHAVSGAEDVNGDGLADVIVGAPYDSVEDNMSGMAYVVFGRADSEAVHTDDVLAGDGGFAMIGPAVRDRGGSAVCWAG